MVSSHLVTRPANFVLAKDEPRMKIVKDEGDKKENKKLIKQNWGRVYFTWMW